MCCQKIDEEDNDAGIEEPTVVDVEVKPMCNRENICLCVLRVVLIGVSVVCCVGLGYLFMQPAGEPCNELDSVKTDHICSYTYNDTIITRDAYRQYHKKVSRRRWICPELCLFDVNETMTVGDCDADCDTLAGWVYAVITIGILLTITCCVYAYETCDCKDDDKK